jgi:hypothetical protein
MNSHAIHALLDHFYQPNFFCKEVINACPKKSNYEYLDPESFVKKVL